jgi:hypothetical protein
MRPVAVTGFVVVAALSAHAQSRTPTPTSGFILGRVIDATSHQPVGGAIVRLTPDSKQPAVLTGADGQFLFSPLSPGFYSIEASKPGYLGGSYGQMRARGQGTKMLLEERERRGNVTVRLWPWASISGRVLDEAGRPLPSVPVEALRRGPNDRLAPFTVRYATRTDSHGSYTIDQLAPGNWLVSAGCHTLPATSIAEIPPQAYGELLNIFERPNNLLSPCSYAASLIAGAQPHLYPLTLFPDAALPDAAVAIPLAAGDSVGNIDFRLRPKPVYRVAGTVRWHDGPPRIHPVVYLVPQGWNVQDASFGYASQTKADGSFVFSAVAPGSYALNPPPQGQHGGELSITVDRDLDDLVLVTRPGVPVAGHVASQPPPADSVRIELLLNQRRFPVQTNASGSFILPNIIPGRYELFATSSSSGWYVAAATVSGREALGATVEIGERGLSDLVLHLNDTPASLVGDVSDSRGAMAAEPTVVLFPADGAYWQSAREDSPLFRTARAWAGLYAFERIPHGDYLLAAVDDAALEEWPDATLLARIAGVAQRIRITPGQARRDLQVQAGIR